MLGGHPIDQGEEWLFHTLSTDATLQSLVGQRIYPYVDFEVSTADTYPVLLYSNLSSVDVTGMGNIFLYADQQWLVKAYDRGPLVTNLAQIMPVVHRLLNRPSGGAIPSGGQVLSCVRMQQPTTVPEYGPVGQVYLSRASQYRMLTQ